MKTKDRRQNFFPKRENSVTSDAVLTDLSDMEVWNREGWEILHPR